MHEISGYKSDTAQDEAQRIDKAAVFEHRDTYRPKYGADSLYGKQHAYPVGSFLILQAFGVEDYFADSIHRMLYCGSVKNICSYAVWGTERNVY